MCQKSTVCAKPLEKNRVFSYTTRWKVRYFQKYGGCKRAPFRLPDDIDMRIAICDDQKVYLNALMRIIRDSLSDRMDEELEIKAYERGQQLICENSTDAFDVIFLDVNMPSMDGRKVAEFLRKSSEELILVFVSQYDEYVFDTFDVSPLAFIRKANLEEETKKVCDKILNKYKEKNESFTVFDDEMSYTLYPAKIWYFESEKHQLNIYYSKGKTERIRYSIKKMTSLLENKGFIRINKSYLVNYRYIYFLDSTDVLMLDMKTRLPLARNRHKEIKTVYFNWMGGRQ